MVLQAAPSSSGDSSADDAPSPARQPAQKARGARRSSNEQTVEPGKAQQPEAAAEAVGRAQPQDHKQLRAAIQAARQNLGLGGELQDQAPAGPAAADSLQRAAPVLIPRSAEVRACTSLGETLQGSWEGGGVGVVMPAALTGTGAAICSGSSWSLDRQPAMSVQQDWGLGLLLSQSQSCPTLLCPGSLLRLLELVRLSE